MQANRASLAEDVIRYIKDHIDSVPELETMILLYASFPKAWTAAEVAVRTYVDVPLAILVLRSLVGKNLLRSSGAAGFVFREDGADAALFERVASAYSANIVAITQLIHSKSSPALREFARAFRFKE